MGNGPNAGVIITFRKLKRGSGTECGGVGGGIKKTASLLFLRVPVQTGNKALTALS